MELLVSFFSVLAFFGAGLVGLVVFVIFLVLGLRSVQDNFEKKRTAWRNLAAATGLTFVPGHSFEIGTIVGDFRERSLHMEAFTKKSGDSDEIYTRITVAGNSSTNQDSLEDSFSKEDVERLLISDFAYQGQLKVQPDGETIIYEKRGDEIALDYLTALFDWLVDLAEAYPAIVGLGGEIVPTLHTIAQEGSGTLRPLIHQMIRTIGRQTVYRLGYRFTELICPICLTHCQVHKVWLHWWESVTYYGCRTCGQSRKLLSCPQGVTVVLDSARPDAYSGQTDGSLEINWLVRRELFDFDRVEIVQADDEAVERFAVQIGNDTDEIRRSRYAHMRCIIGPACDLSENTQRILERTFGELV